MIRQVIGSYRVVAELGRGGMGVVYHAEHVQLGRPAALKMLLPQFSSDAHIVQRFFNEARAASAIDHPGIVEVYDYGTHTDGSAYIVMALLKGESLQSRIALGSLPPLEGATLTAQVASALAAAHARGIVHRDLKPDNIYLVPNELVLGGLQVKLLDFGIAKLAGDQAAEHKTQTGAMIGTPAYMSPEQCMGRSDLDHRTDLYSLGCILFHVLCGRPPFISDQGAGMLIAAHLRDPAPDPRTFKPQVPEALAAIINHLLAKDPADRFQTALDVRDALIGAGANAQVTRPGAIAPVSYEPTIAAPPSRPGAPHAGPGALDATIGTGPGIADAPTTASGSAAEQLLRVAPARTSKRRGLIAVAVVASLGAAVAVLAAAGADRDATPAPRDDTAAAAGADRDTTPAPRDDTVAVREPTPPRDDTAAPTPPRDDTAAPTPPRDDIAAASPPLSQLDPTDLRASRAPPHGTTECPEGQRTTPDTAGRCCWPEQAWSSAKDRCVGTPRCPAGMTATRELCVATATSPIGSRATVKAATTFKLATRSLEPGASIAIRFPAPVHSPSTSRVWVTVVEADKPADEYGKWTFVDDGARTATLFAPTKPGAYEVRLHTHYPAKVTYLRHSVPVTVRDGITAEAP